MANLNGQNIGTNYKGFLNLDSTINTPLDSTLRAVTDGMGTSSPFSISTAQAAIGTYTAASYASAKLIVGNYASANSEVANIGIMAVSQATLNSATAYGYAVYGHGYTNGSARSAGLVGEGKVTVTGDTGSAIGVRGYANDTHAGGFNIGLYGDATGGSSNYALYMAAGDIYSAVAQNWTISALTISGSIKSSSGISALNQLQITGANIFWQSKSVIASLTDGNFTLQNNAGTSFSLLQLGGSTSSFPAIKRNGAAIDFRLADDSNYASISIYNLNCLGNIYYGGNGESITNSGNSGYTDFRSNQGWQFTNAGGSSVYQRFTSAGISFGDSTLVASAQVTINSTTRGFLPPRMTTAQKNAITTPAAGLVVFDTTLAKLAVYTGAAWETVTSA